MLLKNFDTALTAIVMYTTIPKALRDFNGTVRDAYNALPSNNHILAGWGQLKYSSGFITFGDGNQAPSYDDYCLAGSAVTGISVAENVVNSCEDGHIERKVVYTITNNNATSVTIGEIGVLANISYSSGSSYTKMLVERTALESPLTIEPGGVGQITYTLNASVPAASAE